MSVTLFSKKESDDFWIKSASNIKTSSFIDTNLVDVKSISYKISYSLENGTEGEVSKSVKVILKN